MFLIFLHSYDNLLDVRDAYEITYDIHIIRCLLLIWFFIFRLNH